MCLARESDAPNTVRALQSPLNGAGVVPAWHDWGYLLLRDGFLVLYCAAVGFVAAGVAASFYKMVTLEPARFALLGEGWLGAITTFVFCALTGPAIVMDLVIRSRIADRRAVGTLFAGFLVAAVWSVCSGILVLSLVLSLRDSLA